MRNYSAILIILLIISTATANNLEGLDARSIQIIKPINLTNTTINMTDPINITNPINISINITEPINITDPINISINITEPINISINDSIIIIPINYTNFTELNLSIIRNETINLTNISMNITFPINITEINYTENITEINETKLLSPPTSHNSETLYFYAGNKLIASKNNNELKYHYQDRLGSDINSKSLPFGQEIKKGEKFSFTGKELDKELHYFGARYYDSNIGRFTSIDPVKTNPAYQYVKNNPINRIDPDGKNDFSGLELWSIQLSMKNTIPTGTAQIDTSMTYNQLNIENSKSKGSNQVINLAAKLADKYLKMEIYET